MMSGWIEVNSHEFVFGNRRHWMKELLVFHFAHRF